MTKDMQPESNLEIELVELCQSIIRDGTVDLDEIETLHEWLREHRDSDHPAVSFLTTNLERIAEDSSITREEQDAMFVVICRVVDKWKPNESNTELPSMVSLEHLDRWATRAGILGAILGFVHLRWLIVPTVIGILGENPMAVVSAWMAVAVGTMASYYFSFEVVTLIMKSRTKKKQSADELEHTPSQHEVDTAAFGQTLEEKQHQEASRSPKLKLESKPFAMIDGGSGDTSSQRLGEENHQPALVPEEARKDAERKRKLKLSVGIAIGGAVAVMSLAAAALLFNAVRARIAQDRLAAAVRDRIAQERLATAKAARREQPRVTVEVAGISKQPPMVNSVGMELKLLPAGKFMMGSASGVSDETPHKVTLTKPFYLGVYEVTQEEYEKVMGANPSRFTGSQQPVEQVSWNDAVEFCRKLSALPEEKAAGRVYRLPTEAEWEYACRAGTTTAYSFGDDESKLAEYAWYDGNSDDTTHPVGQKKRNPWGLYDMHGNVWEWCQDWYDDYSSDAMTDPVGPNSGSVRVVRGGGWRGNAGGCRSASRSGREPSSRYNRIGLRVVCVPSGQ